jgi:hypothetical protein
MSSIKYDRLYSGSDGTSRVQKNLEIEVTARDFVPPAPPMAPPNLNRPRPMRFSSYRPGLSDTGTPAPSGNGCSTSKEKWSMKQGMVRNGAWVQEATCLQKTRPGKAIEVAS